MNLSRIFFDGNGRLRSGWRFATFAVLFVVAALMIGGGGIALLNALGVPLEPQTPVFFIVNGVLLLIPAVLIGWLCGKYLEGLPFRALGASFTAGWFRNLLAGLVVGAATISLAVLIAYVFGGLRFEPNLLDGSVLARSLGVSLLIFAVGAAWEEALFRGYILQTFARSGYAALAIGLTAVFFGVIHSSNENVGVLAIINTMLAGIWFGIGYLKTRDLWFVWGLHVIWNWMQGAVFGIEVSGITSLASAPLLKELDAGPVWLTGESYGIEGGIVTTIAIVISTAVIYFMPFLKPSEEMLSLTGSQNRERKRPGVPLRQRHTVW